MVKHNFLMMMSTPIPTRDEMLYQHHSHISLNSKSTKRNILRQAQVRLSTKTVSLYTANCKPVSLLQDPESSIVITTTVSRRDWSWIVCDQMLYQGPISQWWECCSFWFLPIMFIEKMVVEFHGDRTHYVWTWWEQDPDMQRWNGLTEWRVTCPSMALSVTHWWPLTENAGRGTEKRSDPWWLICNRWLTIIEVRLWRIGLRGAGRALRHQRDGARDLHVIVIILTRASPTGSRFVRQVLHTSHYAAPPKLRQMPPKHYRAEDWSRSSCNSCKLLWLHWAWAGSVMSLPVSMTAKSPSAWQ